MKRSSASRGIFVRERVWTAARSCSGSFFYLFTCEYCFSHYVTATVLLITRFTLLYDGWRGYVMAEFALVWLANVYMSFFNRLRLDIKHENVAIAVDQTKVEEASPVAAPK